METLTRMGNGAPVSISIPKLAAAAEITPKQAEQAINGLIDSSILTKAWNADKFVWTFTLIVPLVGA
jgi:hypothetical protein